MREEPWRAVRPSDWTQILRPLYNSGQHHAVALWLFIRIGHLGCGIPGVALVGRQGLCGELKLSPDELAKAEIALGLRTPLSIDDDGSLSWLQDAIARDPPPNPNVAKNWRGVLERQLPACDLRERLAVAIRDACKQKGSEWVRAFDAGLGKTNSSPTKTRTRTSDPDPESGRKRVSHRAAALEPQPEARRSAHGAAFARTIREELEEKEPTSGTLLLPRGVARRAGRLDYYQRALEHGQLELELDAA
jgi:hypothetical protein